MQNARLDKAQVVIKIAGRNINNLRYADDTILMAESEKELEPLDEGEEESEKVGLKLNILWLVAAAMKLKDACSLEEKL